MRIITLWQPWASAIALDLKRYETRSWNTTYRGLIAIHAAKRPCNKEELSIIRRKLLKGNCDPVLFDRLYEEVRRPEVYGAVVAVCSLTKTQQMIDAAGQRCLDPTKIDLCSITELEKSLGDWSKGRYAWKLEELRPVVPISWKGLQGMRDAPKELQRQIFDQADELVINVD